MSHSPEFPLGFNLHLSTMFPFIYKTILPTKDITTPDVSMAGSVSEILLTGRPRKEALNNIAMFNTRTKRAENQNEGNL